MARVKKMASKKRVQEELREYYLDMRESFIDKMKSEDDERSNLKFKIAALVIYELTHLTPLWFKDYFLACIAGIDYRPDESPENVVRVESEFHEVVAQYLLEMEKEVDYAKRAISGILLESEKIEFWKPIVFDSFLIAGIYFTPSPISGSISGHPLKPQSSTQASAVHDTFRDQRVLQ